MKNWQLKEKSDAKLIGGRRVRGSGNKWHNPGDSRSEHYLSESKYTDKKSYSLNYNKLKKIYNEALLTYKIPLFMIQIKDINLVTMFEEDWVKLKEGLPK